LRETAAVYKSDLIETLPSRTHRNLRSLIMWIFTCV